MVFYLKLTVALIIMLTLAMYLVCLCTAYWQNTQYTYTIQNDAAIQETHSGLWSGCFLRNNTEYCGHIHMETHWLKAVRAFLILGIIANLAAAIYVVLAFLRELLRFQIVGIILSINAMMILVALSVYAGLSGIPYEKTYEKGNFGWSFIVAWITWVISVLGCVLAFVDVTLAPERLKEFVFIAGVYIRKSTDDGRNSNLMWSHSALSSLLVAWFLVYSKLCAEQN